MIPVPTMVQAHYHDLTGDLWYYVVYIEGHVPWFVVYPTED